MKEAYANVWINAQNVEVGMEQKRFVRLCKALVAQKAVSVASYHIIVIELAGLYDIMIEILRRTKAVAYQATPLLKMEEQNQVFKIYDDLSIPLGSIGTSRHFIKTKF